MTNGTQKNAEPRNFPAAETKKVPRLTLWNIIKKSFSGLHISRIKNRSWQTKAGILLVLTAIASGFATYAALTETPPFGNDSNIVIWLLNIDLILLLLLVSLIARRIVGVWSNRRKGMAGSHLHVRLVYLFSVLVAVPTIIMTIFSAFFFHFGVQAWFSQRVQTAIQSSEAVAAAYLEEHKQVIRADTMAMANDLDRQADLLLVNRKGFSEFVDKQAFYRNLAEAIVMRKDGEALARSALTFSLEYESIPDYAMEEAELGEVALMMGGNQDRVRALVKLRNFGDAYLLVGRMVDPQVLSHLNETKIAVEDYDNLQAQYSGMQITATLIFVVVGLLLLLAAIWSGLLLARQLVGPITEMIVAADRVSSGDLSARVPEEKSLEEFEYLAKSFNHMTEQISQQQMELLRTNMELDQRRHLTESVLAGVSSGVIGATLPGGINLANASAAQLLGKNTDDLVGQSLNKIIPELAVALAPANLKTGKIAQLEIPILTPSAGERTFLFRIVTDAIDAQGAHVIITFDDITELLSAQRKAAWSDVARRIAHEIKNPLTPIQLSAERLKRKYLKQINDDPETFAECTDIIIKHVGDIGHMVDEFSSFARMPEPKMRAEKISDIVKSSLVLPTQAHPDIAFEFHTSAPAKSLTALLDPAQIRQAVTNLIQNAVDSLPGGGKRNIRILVGVLQEGQAFVSISDSGCGFPPDIALDRLTDPYVTQKVKGTGLGLAIVKKIMEDHKGRLILGVPAWLAALPDWDDKGGATVTMLFGVKDDETFNEKKVA